MEIRGVLRNIFVFGMRHLRLGRFICKDVKHFWQFLRQLPLYPKDLYLRIGLIPRC